MALSELRVIEQDDVMFTSDAQLLSELGERLIADPLVALSELVKNAFDADATRVNLWLTSDNRHESITVKDNGRGMAKEEFLSNWMTIGTTAKLAQTKSKKYKRMLTGSKGVGRFAARMIGSMLDLETVAYSKATSSFQKVTAHFPWKNMSSGSDLREIKIHYTVMSGFSKEDQGTTLKISDLKPIWSKDYLKTLTKDILDIISPPLPLEGLSREGGDSDPGFEVVFGMPGQEQRFTRAGDELLDRWQALLKIKLDGNRAEYSCCYKDSSQPRTFSYPIEENLIGDILAEIRYYPKRAGMFSGMETMDGRSAIGFLRDKGGVRIYDRGFRIPPYGEPGDDWLELDKSKARNARQWVSKITENLFPRKKLPKDEQRDPTLKVPANHQLLGVVKVSSFRTAETAPELQKVSHLEPAMDRQGFVENDAFQQLKDVIRAGAELIAVVDREEGLASKKRLERKRTREANRNIKNAIHYVKTSREIPSSAKHQLLESYKGIQTLINQTAEAHKETIAAVESMSLLGVLAGFMTHETTIMQKATEEMLAAIRTIPAQVRPANFHDVLQKIEVANNEINKHIDYAKLFITHIHDKKVEPYLVKPQINRVVDNFNRFLDERSIKCQVEVADNLMSPEIPVGIYSGVLMNLFTNAIKAVISPINKRQERRILIQARADEKGHHLLVIDNGAGIPPEMESYIFQPLVSTTSDVEGPFGPGLGLGLYISKKVVESFHGQISTAEPDEGFSTCFEVTYYGR